MNTYRLTLLMIYDPYYSRRIKHITLRGIHQIAEINGNRVRFHSPFRAHINTNTEVSVNTVNLVQEVGVEDISFHGSFFKDFTHTWETGGELSDKEEALNYGAYHMIFLSRCT